MTEALALAIMRSMPKGLTYEQRCEWLRKLNAETLIRFLKG